MHEKLGKYEVVEKIGTGGFGEVYKAYDPFIKRHTAAKTCSSDDQDVRNRFFQEAEIAGNLNHRNVVTVYDFGVEGNLPYLIQEYLSGEDLDRKIKRRDFLPFAEKLHYLIQVARGLAYAHTQGVIHRDIKPANIRILDDGTAKIMDFGIAKLAQQETGLTQTGMTLGTAAYLAPEQIHGGKVDVRTDIFSFGVMAYELLTYERPFLGEQISAVLYQIIHHEPAALCDKLPNVPSAISATISQCLSKEASGRFRNAGELLAALEQIQESGAAQAETQQAVVTAPLTGPTQLVPALRDAAAAARATGQATISTSTQKTSLDDFELSSSSSRDSDLTTSMRTAPPTSSRKTPWSAVALLVALAVGAAGSWWWWSGSPMRSGTKQAGLEDAARPTAGEADKTEDGSAPDLSGAASSATDDSEQGEPAEPPGANADPAASTVPGANTADSSIADPPEPSSPSSAASPASETAAAVPPPGSTPALPAAPPPAAPPPPPTASRPATVILTNPPWTEAMTVEIDGQTYPLLKLWTLKLRPGTHRLRFAVQDPEYSAEREIELVFEPGKTKTVLPPIPEPATLTVQAALNQPQGRVFLDTKEIGKSPVRNRLITPGDYQVLIRPLADGSELAERVVAASGAKILLTFDLTQGHVVQVDRSQR